MTDEHIERGAAEENSGTPVTPTEVEASEVPPSEPPDEDQDESPN